MRQKYLIFILVLGLSIPHLGTVRRTEDPIRDTQTSPILYKQKMEEEKDGKKGPLTYHVKYNPDDTFLVDPPFAPEGKEVSDQRYEAEAAMDWWEEIPTSESTPAIEEGKAFFDADVKEGEAEASSDSTTGDYWW